MRFWPTANWSGAAPGGCAKKKNATQVNFGAKFPVLKPVVYWRHDIDTGDGVTIDNINVEETVQRVAELIAAEKGLSPALKGSLKVLLLLVSLLLNRLGLDSKNSSKPPSTDPFRKKEPRSPNGRKPGGQPGHVGAACDRWLNPTSSNTSPLTGARSPRATETIDDLKYPLAKRVPRMMRGFTITTNCGDIHIDPQFAEAFRNLATDVLQYQLNRLIRLYLSFPTIEPTYDLFRRSNHFRLIPRFHRLLRDGLSRGFQFAPTVSFQVFPHARQTLRPPAWH
ncbi:DUF6444 domain-containing protein [Desulfobulbus sp.]|uniref:DUF6444 domain-containing protein n=1 Tax=Desulfobulbus sp. TaxID=895 RepID=UPI00359F80F7